MTPLDPLDLIANAILNSEPGTPTNSSNYATPAGGSVWITNPITITGPTVSTNATDSGMMAEEAVEWNFSHKTASLGATIAPPLKKQIFMRAGVQWKNTMGLILPASPAFTDLQLSFLENAGTRGDAQGTIPVIRWSAGAPYSGPKSLHLVLKQPGRFTLGLMGINNNSTPDWTMFELDIIAV